ncbi:MAG TPA: cupredoxin domain-containing protein [Woeseiaceae bacterium]|nr:cupredoxin domain-containing protein [Woeseiaceae bacterium]
MSILTLCTLVATTAMAGGSGRAGANEVVLTAREFTFEPMTLEVERGQAVTLVLENLGVLAHNATIKALGVGTETVQGGDKATLEFTAPPGPGTYEIVCTVPGHKEAGMRAQLEVK